MAWRAAARLLSVWVPKEIIPSSEEKSWSSPALFPRQLPDERRRRLIDRVSVGCAIRLDDWDAITHLYAPCYHLSGPFHQYNKPFKGKFSNTVVLFAPFFSSLDSFNLTPTSFHLQTHCCADGSWWFFPAHPWTLCVLYVRNLILFHPVRGESHVAKGWKTTTKKTETHSKQRLYIIQTLPSRWNIFLTERSGDGRESLRPCFVDGGGDEIWRGSRVGWM